MGQVHRLLSVDLSNKGWGHLSARKLRLRHYIRHEQRGRLRHLRDNMATSMADVVQRPFNYRIIDEVDSILIDEARTPLIISGQVERPTEKYLQAAQVATAEKEDLRGG